VKKALYLAFAFILFLVLGFSLPVSAANADRLATGWTADVQLEEKGHTSKVCGQATVWKDYARLDVDLGKAGDFCFLLKPGFLTVVSQELKAYVEVSVKGSPQDWNFRDLAQAVSSMAMPFGLPVLSVREENRKELKPAVWEGYKATRTQSRFVSELMGQKSSLEMVAWENPSFAPFPLRIDNLDRPGDRVSLIRIRPLDRRVAQKELFSVPNGLSKKDSILELILFTVTQGIFVN